MFGENIKNLRKDKSLTQKEIADEYGVTDRAVSTWENGTAEPNYEILKGLAKKYGVTTDYLLGIDYDKLEKLKVALRENGFAVGDDLTIEQLDKALKIIDMMEGNDNNDRK